MYPSLFYLVYVLQFSTQYYCKYVLCNFVLIFLKLSKEDKLFPKKISTNRAWKDIHFKQPEHQNYKDIADAI